MNKQSMHAPATAHVPPAGLLAQEALLVRNASEIPVSSKAVVNFLALDGYTSGNGRIIRADDGDGGGCCSACCCTCCCCGSGNTR